MQTQPAEPINIKLISIVSLGSALEVYDFMIYALMTPYISKLFFPTHELNESLMLTFATFAIGYVSRPLGGILFGHQGDRKGRKKPFTFTILLMALSTLLIGFLPTYQQIGYLAPALLMALRLIQGISMGGETGGALTYISEHFPDKIGIANASVISGMCSGLLLGYCVHSLLMIFLGYDGLMADGWRIAFWLGALLGIIGYVIRRRFQETLLFQKMLASQRISSVPLLSVLRHHKRQVICGALAIITHSTTIILLQVFLPSWLQLHHEETATSLHSTVLAAFIVLAVLVFGLLYDRSHPKTMLKAAAACHLFAGLPWYWLVINQPSLNALTLPIFSLLVGLMAATQIPIVSELFPTRVRYTGIALSYNLGFIAGGVTPLLSTWLIDISGKTWMPGILLTLGGLASIAVLTLYSQSSTQGQASTNMTATE
ncbi:MFS transporter [Endozoicomonas arenosclerae]|uniref:MFS transporter n=1 Tax=Endozoicomonas arenosclerae TaxID=1633495 RepID=UPI000A5B92FC|nr:MFS transporter [Endozoicomonas arenosclerae]